MVKRDWLKKYWHSVFYMTVMSALLLITLNHQMVFGGYENMLYMSLKSFYSDEPVSVYGEIRLHGDDSSEVGRLLEIPLQLEGEVFFKEGTGHLDVSMEQGGEHVVLGRVELVESYLLLMSEGDELWRSEQLNLSGKIDEDRLQAIYTRMTITEISGKGIEKDVTAYQLDFMEIMNSENMAVFEDYVGIGLEDLDAMVTVEVDKRGRFSSAKLDCGLGEWRIDSWIRLR